MTERAAQDESSEDFINVRGMYPMRRCGDGSYHCDVCDSFVMDVERHADWHDQQEADSGR